MKKQRLFTSLLWSLATIATLASGATWSAEQKVYKFDIQTAVPSSSLYFQLTQKLATQLDKMSRGRLKAEVLPDGAVVKAFDILDAVSSGTVKGGMVWPHYWSGKNSAYVLFSNPPASTGLDQRSFMAWYYQGGGQEIRWGGSRSRSRLWTTFASSSIAPLRVLRVRLTRRWESQRLPCRAGISCRRRSAA